MRRRRRHIEPTYAEWIDALEVALVLVSTMEQAPLEPAIEAAVIEVVEEHLDRIGGPAPLILSLASISSRLINDLAAATGSSPQSIRDYLSSSP